MLLNYSHYSVLDSVVKPASIIKTAGSLGYSAAAIIDTNTMAGMVQFIKASKDSGVKPILGATILLASGAVSLLAKNLKGYHNLIKIVSEVNLPKNHFRFNFLQDCDLKNIDCSDIIALSGHIETSTYNYFKDDDLEGAQKHVELLQDCFGVENTFLCYNDLISKEFYSRLCKNLINHSPVKYGTGEYSRYLYKVVRAVKERVKVGNIPDSEEYAPSNNYLKDYKIVSDMCDEYNILSPPMLPKFSQDKDSDEILTELCREGYKKKIGANKPAYVERIKYELAVFKKAKLADYFLILHDTIQYANSKNYLIGSGRGSAAGCLVSYLIGITKIDPIKYDLMLSRFYNEGRSGSLPDIDTDLPKHARDDVNQYMIKRWGTDKTAQIATYQTLMGKAAIKAVLRAEGNISFSEMNEITKHFEDKAKIADELQEMKDRGEEPSVILWALENKGHKFDEWVSYNPSTKKFSGTMASQFYYASQLEGVKSAQSKHPAGLIVSANPLIETVPMIYDVSSGSQIIGLEYDDAEATGVAKYDLLSLSSLSKLEDI